jgi:DNA-binding NarL/FixJ family response regulator
MTPTAPTRVLVADERPLVRDLLGQAIGRDAEFEVSVLDGSRDTTLAALKSCGGSAVVLFGAEAVDVSVSVFVESVLLACPWASVLVFVDEGDDRSILSALEAGAAGFVTEGTPLEELKERIRAAAARQTVFPAEFTKRLLDELQAKRRSSMKRSQDRPQLTDREQEILQLLTRGLGNAQIASELGVSPNTVKNHLYSIYRKLGVTSRGQAFATAARLGIAV